MSKLPLLIASAALGAYAAAALAQGGPTVAVRSEMQERVNPAMLAIWDIGNSAMDDEGGLDPARLDDAAWAQLAAEANKLAASGSDMAVATNLIVTPSDNREVGEGEIGMDQVERNLSADPVGFRAAATEFAAHAEQIAAAANARDAARAGALIGEMDAVCESCHLQYWYPE